VAELAEQFELHPNQIIHFRQHAVENMVGLFARESALIWTSPGKQVFSVMMFQRVCSLIYGLFVQACKPAGPDGIRE
jgi:hypothetical protein